VIDTFSQKFFELKQAFNSTPNSPQVSVRNEAKNAIHKARSDPCVSSSPEIKHDVKRAKVNQIVDEIYTIDCPDQALYISKKASEWSTELKSSKERLLGDHSLVKLLAERNAINEAISRRPPTKQEIYEIDD
jgi:hypothetical protein